MMETILTFLETTSVLWPLHLLAQMTHTELAIAFLISKPLFVATAACLVGGRSLRDAGLAERRRQLEPSPPDPTHLLEDP